MAKMMLGYILKIDTALNPGRNKFEFKEDPFTRKISSRGDKISSKLLRYPEDYDFVSSTTETMKSNPNFVVVNEPFILDDDLRTKVTRWVDWANHADPKDYDPFYAKGGAE